MRMTDHKVDEAKGRAKEAATSLTDDKYLKRVGKADRAGSSVKKKVDDAVDAAKDKLSGGDRDSRNEERGRGRLHRGKGTGGGIWALAARPPGRSAAGSFPATRKA